MARTEEIQCPVREVTRGPFYHFFGYYDKCPWDVTGRYLLGMRVAFMDRPPTPEDIAPVFVWLARADTEITGQSLEAGDWIGRDPSV